MCNEEKYVNVVISNENVREISAYVKLCRWYGLAVLAVQRGVANGWYSTCHKRSAITCSDIVAIMGRVATGVVFFLEGADDGGM
jgi:hypothetical protein